MDADLALEELCGEAEHALDKSNRHETLSNNVFASLAGGFTGFVYGSVPESSVFPLMPFIPMPFVLALNRLKESSLRPKSFRIFLGNNLPSYTVGATLGYCLGYITRRL